MGSALRDYLRLTEPPQADWDLFRITLELGRIISEPLSIESYLAKAEEIAERVRSMLNPGADLFTQIEKLNDVLFQVYQFQGNQEDYYDTRNSFMTLVLDRRKGIPITLSLLYKEVASRVGLSLNCVAMPGHFLLKYRMAERDIFIDAFGAGRIILADECLELLESLYESDEIVPSPEMLQSTPNRAVLLRLLINLKHIYREQGNSSMLLEILERRIPLLSEPYPEILERGLVKASLEDYRGAFQDLDYCHRNASRDDIREFLGDQLERIRRLAEGN